MIDYLVTGGAGFIGSNVVERLIQDGCSVRVLDNLSTGLKPNLETVADRIEWLEGDIRDVAVVRGAVKGVACVLHLAAIPSVPRSVEDPLTTSEVNIRGTLNLLAAARDEGVGRFIFASSSSVYGDAPGLPKDEDAMPRPMSPYAVQKATGESYCRVFHRLYGLNTFVLRFFNVYGPRQNPASRYAAVVPQFIGCIRMNRSLTIHGDGEQTRDFTFVGDVAAAVRRCEEAPASAAGGIYNVSAGRPVSVNELARNLMKMMGRTVDIVHTAPRQGEIRDSFGDNRRAKTHLGWTAQTGIDEGLRRTVEYWQESE